MTEYYTMVNEEFKESDRVGAGNQIVNGQLYGSDKLRRPIKKYCPFGIGTRDTCITPCRDAAGGGAYVFGQTVQLPKPFMCKWGPLKGQKIYSVRIVDVGGGVQGTHIDLFQGLCEDVKRDRCVRFAPDDMRAQYGGQGGPTRVQEAAIGNSSDQGSAR